MPEMKAFLVAIAALAVAMPARGDTQACVEAHVAVQEKRLAGDLRGAHAAAAICGATDCPAALRTECERWSEDLVTELPSVEIAVTGALPAAALALRIDGEPYPLGGAIALNPGHHSVELMVAGKPTRRSLHLIQGQRAKLEIDLTTPGPEPVPEKPATREIGTPVGPIVLGAVGVATLGVFAVMGGLGAAEFAELQERCAPHCTETDTDPVDTKLLVADVALGIGSAAVVAGAIWLVVELVADGSPPVNASAGWVSIAF
jgi:hypothetical protein